MSNNWEHILLKFYGTSLISRRLGYNVVQQVLRSGIWEFPSSSVSKWNSIDLPVLARYLSAVTMLNGTGVSGFATNTTTSKFRCLDFGPGKEAEMTHCLAFINGMTVSWRSDFNLCMCLSFFQVQRNWLQKSSIWSQPGLNKAFLALAPAFSARSATACTEEAVAPDERMSLTSQKNWIQISVHCWNDIAGNKKRMLNISRQAEGYTQEYCAVLLGLQALTRCVTANSFIDLGKVKTFKKLQNVLVLFQPWQD